MTTTMFCPDDDEEDASFLSNTFVGTQAAGPGPDSDYLLHRPPNGNGSAEHVGPLPPVARSPLCDDPKHAITPQRPEQRTAVYTHQAHTLSPACLLAGVPTRGRGLVQGSTRQGPPT